MCQHAIEMLFLLTRCTCRELQAKLKEMEDKKKAEEAMREEVKCKLAAATAEGAADKAAVAEIAEKLASAEAEIAGLQEKLVRAQQSGSDTSAALLQAHADLK